MKRNSFIFLALLCICISCIQKAYTHNSFLFYASKEVPEMLLIQGMEYIGSNNCEGAGNSVDSLGVYIGSFFVSKHEITNKEFCCFLNEDSIRENRLLIKEMIAIGAEQNKIITEDDKYKPVKGFENYPVVMVSWWGARQYCEWLTALANKKNIQNGRYTVAQYRLPSEYEWVYATSLSQKQSDFIIPSSDETADSLNLYSFPAHDVKKDSLIQSGIAGMNENVYEWTDDNFHTKRSTTDYSMDAPYEQVISPHALVRKYCSSVGKKNNGCGRISRLRTGFYSDTGFRIVQTHLGRSSGFEF